MRNSVKLSRDESNSHIAQEDGKRQKTQERQKNGEKARPKHYSTLLLNIKVYVIATAKSKHVGVFSPNRSEPTMEGKANEVKLWFCRYGATSNLVGVI